MTRSERLLAILQFMRGRKHPAIAADLAQHFGVSERTIYRDISTLVERGAIIEGAAGFGFILRDDYFLPPLSFDKGEAEAILLGLRFVAMRGDTSLAASAASVKAKLGSVLPRQFAPETSAQVALVVGPSSRRHAKVLGTVREALTKDLTLEIDYKDDGGELSHRRVWPVLLGWFDEAEMLAAWCELRCAFRHFRVDRIVSCRLTDDRPGLPRRRLLADYQVLEPDVML